MQQINKLNNSDVLAQQIAPKKKATNKTVTPIGIGGGQTAQQTTQTVWDASKTPGYKDLPANPRFNSSKEAVGPIRDNNMPVQKPGFGMPTTTPSTGGDIPHYRDRPTDQVGGNQNGKPTQDPSKLEYSRGGNGQQEQPGTVYVPQQRTRSTNQTPTPQTSSQPASQTQATAGGLLSQGTYTPAEYESVTEGMNVPESDYQPYEYESVTGDASSNAPTANTPQTTFTRNDYQSNGYNGVQGDTDFAYDPRDESLVQNQITGLLDPNSDLMRKAISQAQGYSAGRGLQSSSIGSETALSTMIDKAMPIAQQDAATYGNADQLGWQNSFTADQNNLSREHDASMFDKQGELTTNLQNDQLQFNNDQNNANRNQEAELQYLQYQQNLGLLDAQGQQQLQQLNAQQQFQAEMQDLQYQQSLGTLDAEGAQRLQELNAQQSFNMDMQNLTYNQNMSTLDKQAELQERRDELLNQFDVDKVNNAFLQDLEKTQLTWEHDDAVFERNLNGQFQLEYKTATATAYNSYLEQVAAVFSNPNMTPEQQTAGANYLKQMFEAQRQQMQIIYGSASGQVTDAYNPPTPNDQLNIPYNAGDPQQQIIPNAGTTTGGSTSGGGISGMIENAKNQVRNNNGGATGRITGGRSNQDMRFLQK